jgi:hypothetical protein
MIRSFVVFILLVLVIAAGACAPVTPATPEPSPSPEAVQPSKGPYSLSTRTGDAKIDAVLEAVASGSVEDLHPFLAFSRLECTRQDGLGGPPKCQEGEDEGTIVEALPFLGSEGSFLRKEDLGNWKGIDVSGIYAIYDVSTEVYSDEYYPAGEQAILLNGSRDDQPIALRLRNGKIVRIDYLFDFGMESLDAILQREASNIILAATAK